MNDWSTWAVILGMLILILSQARKSYVETQLFDENKYLRSQNQYLHTAAKSDEQLKIECYNENKKLKDEIRILKSKLSSVLSVIQTPQ